MFFKRRELMALGAGLILPAPVMAASSAPVMPSPAPPPQPGADLPVPQNGSLRFRIMRKGDVIGTHGLTFTQQGRTDLPPPATPPAPATTASAASPAAISKTAQAGTGAKEAAVPAKPSPPPKPPVLGPLTVHVIIDIAVKLGPIPLYRYNHESTEIWHGDTLESFVSATNDNGVHTKVMAKNKDGKFWVETIKEKYAAPEDAIPTTYWNPKTLSAPLIDNIDGKLLRAKIARIGPETISAANGDRIDAVRYVASGDLNLNLWYAEDKPKLGEKPGPIHWVGLALVGSDGSHVSYELL